MRLNILAVANRGTEKDLIEPLPGSEDIEAIMSTGEDNLRSDDASSPIQYLLSLFDDNTANRAVGVLKNQLIFDCEGLAYCKAVDLLRRGSELNVIIQILSHLTDFCSTLELRNNYENLRFVVFGSDP